MVSDGLFQDTAWGSLCLWLQSSMDPCDQLHMGSLQWHPVQSAGGLENAVTISTFNPAPNHVNPRSSAL